MADSAPSTSCIACQVASRIEIGDAARVPVKPLPPQPLPACTSRRSAAVPLLKAVVSIA